MDYTGFLRTYISACIREVKRCGRYSGRHDYAALNGTLNEGECHYSDAFSDVLPSLEPNINASVDTFELYSDSIAKMTPDMGLVFPDRDGLRKIYANLSNNMGDDDEKMRDMLIFAAHNNVEILKKMGVLSNGDNIR